MPTIIFIIIPGEYIPLFAPLLFLQFFFFSLLSTNNNCMYSLFVSGLWWIQAPAAFSVSLIDIDLSCTKVKRIVCLNSRFLRWLFAVYIKIILDLTFVLIPYC